MKFKGKNVFYAELFAVTKQFVAIKKYESEKRDLMRSNFSSIIKEQKQISLQSI